MMVKVCRVPAFSRHIFTGNELSGWMDGVSYTPSELRERRKAAKEKRRAKRIAARLAAIPVLLPPEVSRVEIGYSL